MLWQDKVKNLMKSKNINQKQLSNLSGIAESSISRYLNGDKPVRTDIILNFAKALNVTADYLLSDLNEETTDPYTEIATAIARNGKELTAEEKNKLIAILLGEGE